VGYSYAHTKQTNDLYRLDWLEEMNDAGFGVLPSTRNALLSALDSSNSYITTRNNNKAYVTTALAYEYDVREQRNNDYVRTALWRLTFTPGLELNAESFDFNGRQKTRNTRTELLPTIMLRIERNTPGMKHQIWLEGNYKQQLPSMFSLMGLRFDSDPLNINEGNTDLRRTEIYSADLLYSSDQWGREKQRRLSAKLTATFYRNAVATAQLYDATTGVRTYRPENVNGNYSVGFNSNFNTPLDAKRRFTFNVGLSNNFYRNIDQQATGSQAVGRSTVYTNYLSVPLGLEYNKKKFRIGSKFQLAWHNARSERKNFQNVNGINTDASIYGNVRLPWSVTVATDFKYCSNSGFTDKAMNKDYYLWNAELTKSILKGNLTFALVAYDILRNISDVNYTVNMQGVTETWRNVIPSYGMFRIIYKLNKQPKKKH
jgi:hypothetical protein